MTKLRIVEMGILIFLLLSLLGTDTGGVGVKEDYWEDGEVQYDRELDTNLPNKVEESSEVEDITVETPVESNNTEIANPLDVNDSETPTEYSEARTVGEG